MTTAHNSTCMGSLLQNQHIESHSMLLFVIFLENTWWKDGSSISHLLFCWDYRWHLKMQSPHANKEIRYLRFQHPAHLSWNIWNRIDSWWSIGKPYMQRRKSVCCKQSSNLRRDTILYIFVHLKIYSIIIYWGLLLYWT